MQENNNYYENPNVETSNNGPYPEDGKATASMICGIIGVIPCFWSLLGLVLGIVAVVLSSNYVKATGDRQNSKAKAGQICGIIAIIGSVVSIIATVVYTAGVISFTGL